MAITTAILTTVSTVASVESSKKAEEARKVEQRAAAKQSEAQRKIANIKAQRERTRAFREERKQRGKVQAEAEASGVSSTMATGFTAGVRTQTAGAVGAGQRISGITEQVSIFNEQAMKEAGSLYGQAAEFSGVSAFAGGMADVASIFKTPKNPPKPSSHESVHEIFK